MRRVSSDALCVPGLPPASAALRARRCQGCRRVRQASGGATAQARIRRHHPTFVVRNKHRPPPSSALRSWDPPAAASPRPPRWPACSRQWRPAPWSCTRRATARASTRPSPRRRGLAAQYACHARSASERARRRYCGSVKALLKELNVTPVVVELDQTRARQHERRHPPSWTRRVPTRAAATRTLARRAALTRVASRSGRRGAAGGAGESHAAAHSPERLCRRVRSRAAAHSAHMRLTHPSRRRAGGKPVGGNDGAHPPCVHNL
jgi:hypothetical protein